MHEPDVEVLFSANPADIENADLVIVPGTKNTVKDLLFLRKQGIDSSIRRAWEKGVQVIGLCGGYQMLGRCIRDPLGIESPYHTVDGIGLLPIETDFKDLKTTSRSTGNIQNPGVFCHDGPAGVISGYEIHMGTSSGDIDLFRVRRQPGGEEIVDGAMNKNCWGTYLHGIFENDLFRRTVLNNLRSSKGIAPLESSVSYSTVKDNAIDRLADLFRENVDMNIVDRLVNL
jgi:adenosylcobyric acid synthase